MRRAAVHSLLLVLFALGGVLLPPLHRAQHAREATPPVDAAHLDATCDLCAATLAPDLAAPPVLAPVVHVFTYAPAPQAVWRPATDPAATGRGPPRA